MSDDEGRGCARPKACRALKTFFENFKASRPNVFMPHVGISGNRLPGHESFAKIF